MFAKWWSYCLGLSVLTHLPLVPHICVSESGQHWFREWLGTHSGPSHCLNQCWVIVNWTLRNKLRRNFYQNTKLFIHKNASENIISKKATNLSRGRWVKSWLGPMSTGAEVMWRRHNLSTFNSGIAWDKVSLGLDSSVYRTDNNMTGVPLEMFSFLRLTHCPLGCLNLISYE